MHLTLVDRGLWLGSFVGQCFLLAILLRRKRYLILPIFTILMAFECLQNVIDWAAYAFASADFYFWTYWCLAILDSLLQLSLVYEMSREILRPTGTWVRDARSMVFLFGAVGALLAAALSYAVDPKGSSDLFAWSIRLDLFTSLLIAELVVAMSLAAKRLGLQWRSWVVGLGQGLMLWVSVSLFVATAQSYWGWTQRYLALDHLRILAFIGALGYWCVVFWRNEPERKPISPEMMKYLYALQGNLAYDLGRVESKRK